MKTRNLLLLLPVAALAVGFMIWEPDDYGHEYGRGRNPGKVNNASEPDPAGSMTAVPAVAEQSPPASVSGSPASVAATVREPACEIAYLPAGDGTVVEVLSCEPGKAVERHPYESYSSAALESLAYADAKAAEVLGMRLREADEAKAMSLMLRASALAGGDTAPIFQYFNAYPHADAIDDVPVRKTVHTKFVLSAVADLLSTDTNYVAHWEAVIRRYSSDPETELAMLQTKALRIVEEMRQIQLEVSGSSKIGGRGDA